jgi:hypothetical protein
MKRARASLGRQVVVEDVVVVVMAEAAVAMAVVVATAADAVATAADSDAAGKRRTAHRIFENPFR